MNIEPLRNTLFLMDMHWPPVISTTRYAELLHLFGGRQSKGARVTQSIVICGTCGQKNRWPAAATPDGKVVVCGHCKDPLDVDDAVDFSDEDEVREYEEVLS